MPRVRKKSAILGKKVLVIEPTRKQKQQHINYTFLYLFCGWFFLLFCRRFVTRSHSQVVKYLLNSLSVPTTGRSRVKYIKDMRKEDETAKPWVQKLMSKKKIYYYSLMLDEMLQVTQTKGFSFSCSIEIGKCIVCQLLIHQTLIAYNC